MIKFIIGFITLVLIGLTVYSSINKKAEEIPKNSITNTNVVKDEVTEEKTIFQTERVNVPSKQIIKKTTEKKDILQIPSTNEKDIEDHLEAINDYNGFQQSNDFDERKIESELNGDYTNDLDHELLQKIESELENSSLLR